MQSRALETIPGSVNGTIRLPRFSKSLLLRDLSVDTGEPSGERLEVSCSYDLASILRLLPGQDNEEFAEYDEVLVDRAVSRSQCYCGRISRHGLLFLISRHLQNITTAETTSGGSTIVAQTTLGRFKFYEHNDKPFVHFDRGTRSLTSIVDLVPNQTVEDILEAASGRYLVNESSYNMNFVWRRCSSDLQVEDLATWHYFGMPNAVIYMGRNVLESWKRLKRFSRAMVDAMTSVLDHLEEPSSFVAALKTMRRSSTNNGGKPHFGEEPAERLACCVWLCETLAEKNVEELTVERELKIFFVCLLSNFEIHLGIRDMIQLNLTYLIEVHQHFRSPRAEHLKLFTASGDRFARLFRQHSAATNVSDSLREELRALLISNRNNVALVVYQGFFAILARFNSAKVLRRAREAPQEWIRFIVADDDYIYIG